MATSIPFLNRLGEIPSCTRFGSISPLPLAEPGTSESYSIVSLSDLNLPLPPIPTLKYTAAVLELADRNLADLKPQMLLLMAMPDEMAIGIHPELPAAPLEMLRTWWALSRRSGTLTVARMVQIYAEEKVYEYGVNLGTLTKKHAANLVRFIHANNGISIVIRSQIKNS